MQWVWISLLLIGILKFGQALLAPLLVAVFVWYLLNAIAEYYKKLIPGFKFAGVISGLASVATFGGLITIFAKNVRPVFAEVQEKLPQIEERITSVIQYVAEKFNITTELSWLPSLQDTALYVGSSVAGLAASIGIITIYVLFMFVEQSTFKNKFKNLFETNEKFAHAKKVLTQIDAGMKKYLFAKTAISLATALCAYVLMSALGLDLALFWAFLIFVLNYIPTFGSIIAVVLPAAYAFASLSVISATWIMAGLIGLEILFANILEPKIMGKTLNLSTLAILVNLVFWGMLWGAVGMFFSVPILVAIFIIASHIKPLRKVAVLLSADGVIDNKNSEEKPKKSKRKR